MAFRPRALRRVLVVGAVVALSTVFLAPMAASGETSSSSDTSSSLDPPGVDVPGWQAAKVSGEATGCHSEVELNVNPLLLQPTADAAANAADVSEASTQIGSLSAALKALPGGAPELTALLDKLSTQLTSVNSAESEGEDALIHAEAGPVPTVELPWQGGGPVTEEEGDCTLDLFSVIHIPLAKDLKVESEGAIGAAGYSHTEATSQDNFGLIYVADEVDTECLATLADIEAKTEIKDGQYIDIQNNGGVFSASLKDIPEHPDKNDELTDFQFTSPAGTLSIELSLTANAQDEGDKHVTVTGLVSEFKLTFRSRSGVVLATLTADGIRDQSHCDIDPQPTAITVEPKFTG